MQEKQRSNQQVPIGQQIFGTNNPVQQPPQQMGQMNPEMMQQFMKFFGQMMNQPNTASFNPSPPQNATPMNDLEKFFANKVNDMNSFYSQISQPQKSQENFYQAPYNIAPTQMMKNPPSHYQPINEDNDYQEDQYLHQTSKFINQNIYQPIYNPSKYCDEETQMRLDSQHNESSQQQIGTKHQKQDSFVNDHHFGGRPFEDHSIRRQQEDHNPRYANSRYQNIPYQEEDKSTRPSNKYQEEIKQNKYIMEDERPIKSTPQCEDRRQIKNKYDDEKLVKPAKSALYADDERPIRSQKNNNNNFEDDDRPINTNKNQPNIYDDERPIKPQKNNQYSYEDERPIKPAKNNNSYMEGDQKKNSSDKRPIQPVRHNQYANEFDERPIKPTKNTGKQQQIDTFDDQPIETTYKNPIDEMPIKPLGKKNFDEVLDEFGAPPPKRNQAKPAVSDDGTQKKTFLKKGTRKYLSNAQQRSHIAEKEYQEIIKENQQSSIADFVNNVKKDAKKRNDSPPIKSKFTESNVQNQISSNTKKSNKENQQKQPSQQPTVQRQQKKSASYLAKGEGRGGGKGNVPKQDEMRVPNKSVFSDEDNYNQNKNEFDAEYRFDDQEDWQGFDEKKKKTNNYSSEEEEAPKSPKGKQKIVQKYFGGNDQDKISKQSRDENNNLPISKEQEEEIVKKYVQGKIDTLNSEIAKLKAENDKVRKSKIKNEDQLRQLTREREEWEKQKELERQQLEDWKEEEKKKMIREKRVQERQLKTFGNQPNRKEREEIEQLKQQIQKMQEDFKAKEQKSKLNYDRMKKQCEDLLQRNNELQQEIKALENARIQDNNPKKGNVISSPNITINSKIQVQQNKSVALPPPKNTINIYQDEQSENEEVFDEEDQEQNEQEQSDDEYNQIVNVPDNNNKKVQFVQSSYANQQVQHQKSPIKNDKLNPKKQYDLISIADLGRLSIKYINQNISENEFCFDKNKFYRNYISSRDQQSKIVSQNVGADGKIQRIFANGKKEVIFHNGVKREVFPDGYTIVHFTNSDIKQTLPNGTIIYFFADANTTQTTLPQGPNIYRFANQQIEIHFQDCSKEIKFSDGTEKFIKPNGEEETLFSDGIFQRIDSNKVKYIEYPNGNVDIVYPDGQKVRQYKNKDN